MSAVDHTRQGQTDTQGDEKIQPVIGVDPRQAIKHKPLGLYGVLKTAAGHDDHYKATDHEKQVNPKLKEVPSAGNKRSPSEYYASTETI